MNHSIRALFAAAFVSAGAAQLPAQSCVGGVRGLIQDPGGAAIADAKVTLVNSSTQVSRSTVSSGQGEYVFSQIASCRFHNLFG